MGSVPPSVMHFLYAGAGYLSSDVETVAGLRIAALLGAAGAAYGCFGALFRSQPRWLPTVLAVETAWLAAQLIAALVIVRLGHFKGSVQGDDEKSLNKAYTLLMEAIPENKK